MKFAIKLAVLLAILLAFSQFALADLGPKPVTTVNFTFNGKEMPSNQLFISRMAECVQATDTGGYSTQRIQDEFKAVNENMALASRRNS